MRAIPPRARHFYDCFIECANEIEPLSHDLDRERFYHFIWVAHNGRIALTDDELWQHLVSDGFGKAEAAELAALYASCREFLQARETIPYVTPEDWAPSASA